MNDQGWCENRVDNSGPWNEMSYIPWAHAEKLNGIPRAPYGYVRIVSVVDTHMVVVTAIVKMMTKTNS